MLSTNDALIELSDAELDTVAAAGGNHTSTSVINYNTWLAQFSAGNIASALNLGINISVLSWNVTQANAQSASANAGNNVA